MQPVRVVIVEDPAHDRNSLAALVEGTTDVHVVGQFADWKSVGERLDGRSADVVVAEMQSGKRGVEVVEAVRGLKSRFPALQILMLSETTEADGLFEAICAGVYGCLLKNSPRERVLQAVRELHEGGAPMSPAIARRVVTMFQSTVPPRQSDHRLTSRELQVLRLLAEGHSYKTAAAELGLGVDTVRFHIRHIYEKLHVHSKSEAVLAAFRSGVLP